MLDWLGIERRHQVMHASVLEDADVSDLYGLVLTILQPGHPPRQVQVGNPVPPAGVPLLYPGSNLPARALPDQPQAVVIDWDAALAEASR